MDLDLLISPEPQYHAPHPTPCCELYPTMVTPFDEDGRIDYGSISEMINLFSRNNCDGVFAVCQSSEMFYLSHDEKLSLAAFCIEKCRQNNLKCVVSGNTEDNLPDQIRFLKALEVLSPDAIVLVSNRLAAPEESDDTWMERLQIILNSLSPLTRLGMYECPFPYKRLLSPEMLSFMLQTGRFGFIKDTCCDIPVIRERTKLLYGTSIKLYNANAATLLESLYAGASGYSGIGLNVLPELFCLLKKQLRNRHMARQIADKIVLYCMLEYQLYPANAKYLLKARKVVRTEKVRCSAKELTPAQKLELDSFLPIYRHDLLEYDLWGNTEKIFASGAYFENCHASTILPLDDGTVLVAYFAGTREGEDDVGIWISRRISGIWTPPECIANDHPLPHWNPVLFRSGDCIRIVYKVGKQIPSWESRTRVSYDQGKTWSEEMSYSPYTACGPVRSKPLFMTNGRLLAPNSSETRQQWMPCVDISDDAGASFQKMADIPINHSNPYLPNFMEGLGAIQPTLWESEQGHIHMLLRTTSGSIFRSDSADYGQTWCEAYCTELPNNNSGIEIEKAGDTLYLLLNPIGGNGAKRTPLVILYSKDNGNHFAHFKTLEALEFDAEDQTVAEFSYPSAVAKDGRLYVAYTYLRKQIAFCEIPLS